MGIFLLDKPNIEKPDTWIFYILTTWPIRSKEDEEDSENRLERLRNHMDGWADPYKSVVEWLPDDLEITKNQLKIWHPRLWDNYGGRVTLAGDAAHRYKRASPHAFPKSIRLTFRIDSMSFHRGQGGNLAIQDAHEFVKTLVAVKNGIKRIEDAVAEYDRGVVERGREVAISKAQTEAFHDYENFLQSPVVKMGIRPSAKLS
jgi:2-polyprenyl-6-methoxyphenol hydroxylase-like FAD-dependent oxidoreductase